VGIDQETGCVAGRQSGTRSVAEARRTRSVGTICLQQLPKRLAPPERRPYRAFLRNHSAIGS